MKTITVSIDPEAWRNMVEGFGDGSVHWDLADSEPVYERVIDPIDTALASDAKR